MVACGWKPHAKPFHLHSASLPTACSLTARLWPGIRDFCDMATWRHGVDLLSTRVHEASLPSSYSSCSPPPPVTPHTFPPNKPGHSFPLVLVLLSSYSFQTNPLCFFFFSSLSTTSHSFLHSLGVLPPPSHLLLPLPCCLYLYSLLFSSLSLSSLFSACWHVLTPTSSLSYTPASSDTQSPRRTFAVAR